jgi:diguanylate cyclase (GGDEF)-like protein/PAS domain S-box-containing protein
MIYFNNNEDELLTIKTTLKKISKKLKVLEEKYLALTETAVDAIISINKEGTIIFCNPAAKKVFGYGNEIIGKNITTLIPEQYRQPHQMGMHRYLRTGIPKIIGKTVELVGLKKDGTEFPIELSLSVWRSHKKCHFTGIIRDITERKRLEQKLLESNKKLEDLSIRDGLTNLYNRRYMYQALETEFKRAKRRSAPLSCLILDIDHFKKINDLYGHPFGDQVLVYFASFLLKTARSTDIVCRHGGEEFLIVLPDTNMSSAADFAERLRDDISKHTLKDKKTGLCTGLTVSIGISSFTENIHNKEELICQADKALYEAKQTGRNKVCYYTEPTKLHVSSHLAV